MLFYFLFDPSKLNLILVLSVNFILAICNIFEDVSFNASMPAIAGRQNLTRVNSINSGITSLSSIAGPFIGGIIFGFVDLSFFIMANALSFLSAALLELLINFNLFPEEAPEIQKKALNLNLFFSELKEGFSFVKSQKTILIIFSAAVFINFFFNFGINVPFPYIINNVIGLSPSQFGILESFFPGGMLMGSLVLALLPERKNLALTLYISLLTISAYIFITGFIVLPFLLRVLSKNFYFFANIFLILVAGISSSFANIPILSLLQKNIPSDLRGRVFGLISSMSSLMEPVGMFLAGLLVDNVPVYILSLTSAVFLALLTNYIYFGLRSEA
ncbi:MFS transporter [Thermovenabulum sp.]|uniref:MFS transporter n=1 Tax=Thermovenabulum sp. TaxID=3100335 RepID=UPI003C7E6CAB